MVTRMKACIQRVSRARVEVAGETVARIEHGLLVLLGVEHGDDEPDARSFARKIVGLRIFEDDHHKMNRSLADVDGRMLVVSQFTLLGDCRKGRRPSFTDAAPPEIAERLYGVFVDAARAEGLEVATGRFRQHMRVELVNDGPVTLWIDSTTLAR